MARYSAEERAAIARGEFFTKGEMAGVCAYCYEPGDERSQLQEDSTGTMRHPECQQAWDAEKSGGVK